MFQQRGQAAWQRLVTARVAGEHAALDGHGEQSLRRTDGRALVVREFERRIFRHDGRGLGGRCAGFFAGFLVTQLRGFHQQVFPVAGNGFLRRLGVGLQAELAVL